VESRTWYKGGIGGAGRGRGHVVVSLQVIFDIRYIAGTIITSYCQSIQSIGEEDIMASIRGNCIRIPPM
jgi:hypothetical protein